MTQHAIPSRAEQYRRFASWLDGKIADAGWSNNRAAQMMNVVPTTLKSWREGMYLPTPGNARVIAWVLDVSQLEVLCYLFDVTDEDLMAELARRGV